MLGGSPTNQGYSLWVDGHYVSGKAAISLLAQTGSNTVAVAWYANVSSQYRVQSIDEVDAPANAWSDATGWVMLTNNPAAVALSMPTNAPNRFYRVVRQL